MTYASSEYRRDAGVEGDEEDASDAPSQPKPANEIPNGGLRAWLQVVAAFMVFFNTWYYCPFSVPIPGASC